MQIQIGQFYSTSYFYNWIKKSENAPTTNRLMDFRIFFPELYNNNQNIPSVPLLFSDCEKFILSVQSVNFPNFSGANEVNVSTPWGNWQGMDNSIFKADSFDLQLHLLETNIPLQETFIWNWFLSCYNEPNTLNIYPFLRCDFTFRLFNNNFFREERRR